MEKDLFITDCEISNMYSSVVDLMIEDNRKLINCDCSKNDLKENFNHCLHETDILSFINTRGKLGSFNISFTLFETNLKRLILNPPSYITSIPNNIDDKLKLIKSLLSYIYKIINNNK